MNYVTIIDVIETNGAQSRVKAYTYDVIDDYIYFYGPGVTKRVRVDRVAKMIFRGRDTNWVVKLVTYAVTTPTTKMINGVFTSYMQKICPSDHPLVKLGWKAIEKAAVFGVWCVENYIVSTAVENTIVPFWDGVKLGYEQATVLFGKMKGDVEDANEEVMVKEVFEENPENQN